MRKPTTKNQGACQPEATSADYDWPCLSTNPLLSSYDAVVTVKYH